MPPYDERVDAYGPSKSHFFLPTTPPSWSGAIKNRRSTTSLRVTPNLASEEDSTNGRHSLAHELAVALMPEPSPGSKLLAEEFGIEYDQGAEGIDSEYTTHNDADGDAAIETYPSFADELGSRSPIPSANHHLPDIDEPLTEVDRPLFVAQPALASPRKHDSMDILELELESTDKFLSHLRHLDIDSAGASVAQPVLEKIASDVIRHINDTTRDREGQVRALLEYEREFRKIAGEIGGNEVLGRLEELPPQEDLSERPPAFEPVKQDSRRLESVAEEDPSGSFSNDWETDPDLLHLDADDEITHSPIQSPVKDSFFPSPPPVDGPPTVAKSIPQLIHLRSLTTSLVTSLSTISDQAQVNGVATTEAGRKIRALKNKLGGWRMDWDSAERSRLRIERWETGLPDTDLSNGLASGFVASVRRTDGRKLVKEHLKAFEQALAEAALKTKAIMAS